MTQQFHSLNEFREWQRATADYAKLAMRKAPSPMIEDAIRNGWTRSCQDILRDAIRQYAMEQSALPPMEWVASVSVPNRKPDLERDYYRVNGQSLTEPEIADIKSARAMLPSRPSRKDQAAGEAA